MNTIDKVFKWETTVIVFQIRFQIFPYRHSKDILTAHSGQAT